VIDPFDRGHEGINLSARCRKGRRPVGKVEKSAAALNLPDLARHVTPQGQDALTDAPGTGPVQPALAGTLTLNQIEQAHLTEPSLAGVILHTKARRRETRHP
jgi:hypothetical protein